MHIVILRVMLILLFVVSAVRAQPTEQEARAALRKAAAFYSKQVAVRGGYVYQYSADLAKREGEGVADALTVWVQPPGTPTVGEAYLRAYQASGEAICLEAARDAAKCLLEGQLRSGGWQASIEFSDEGRKRWAYRTEPERRLARNPSSLDDDKTQSALRFLMKLDAELKFEDESLHEAVIFALDALLGAQHANGGWRVYEGPAKGDAPVRQATIPDSWPRTYPGGDYWFHYTLNDGAMLDAIEVCFLAYDIYGEQRYFDAAARGGDFLLLAQLPEPQAAWAQQYDTQMHPAWARKFEPPAVSGGESQKVMQTLVRIYERTGDRKYLEPIPGAIAYLRRSTLPNGKLARFYELKTNKPLYATPELEITYDDARIRSGYGFQVESRLDAIERELRRVERGTSTGEVRRRAFLTKPPQMTTELAAAAQEACAGLDERGAWVEKGRLAHFGKADATQEIISSRTFSKRVRQLADYIAASRSK